MAVRIPIDERQIADFCRRHHILKLTLFGSVLRDDFTADSDIDVLVIFEPGHVPGLSFVDIQEELAGMLGRRVDLNTPGFLSPYIRERIAREAQLLYAED